MELPNSSASSLTVTLPYPEGTNSSYRFTVVHMFTQNALGKTAGEVEYPAVTNTAEGIRFTVTSLSPIAVGWTAPSTGGSGGGSSVNYSINLPSGIPNGKLTSDRKSASKGTTVTITVTPDDGYTLDTLTVTDKDGKQLVVTAASSSKYTFTMPAGKVTVSASFVKSGDAPCGKANCPVGRFTDTSVIAWYHDGVHYCVENGMMNGNSATTFNPNGTTTRSQIVAILWRLEGSPVVNSAMDLSDVPGDVYYTEAVRWAQANGVVTGYNDGTFKPNSPITREQMAAVLWRYAKYKGVDVSVGEDTNILSYPDAMTVSEYAIPAMQWACGSGTVQGTTDGRLNPKGSATRAQVATILMRYCENIVK